MSAIQLNFTIRTTPRTKSVHLLGSWDAYTTPLSLSPDPSRPAGWKGTFRFPASALQPGGRYWYYYITDGVRASHDPARPAVQEPTTKRMLNVLDIPLAKNHHPGSTSMVAGRGLSPSRIAHPLPSRPYETHRVRSAAFAGSREMEDLSRRYAAQRLGSPSSEEGSSGGEDSDCSGTSRRSPASYSSRSPASYSSRSSYNSSSSSVSSLGSPITPTGGSPPLSYQPGVKVGLGISGVGAGRCECERWAFMRDGSRVRVDCGGRVCGSEGSSVSSEESESESEGERRHKSHHRSHHRSSHHRSSRKGSSSSSKRHKEKSKGFSLFGRR